MRGEQIASECLREFKHLHIHTGEGREPRGGGFGEFPNLYTVAWYNTYRKRGFLEEGREGGGLKCVYQGNFRVSHMRGGGEGGRGGAAERENLVH